METRYPMGNSDISFGRLPTGQGSSKVVMEIQRYDQFIIWTGPIFVNHDYVSKTL